ncbi:MAG TPA: penicillin-insensitive murein endopeptidase [Magnetospirillaceae bacterium]|jgi:penicillin-insensitive murein endopeptidase
MTGLFLSAAPAFADENVTPVPGAPDSIGSPANGCVVGATEMPTSGPNWEVLRPSTHHDWGNPFLIAFLEDMAAKAKPLGKLIIGDLGAPRGGPILIGHASHQMGLDVDVLFRLLDEPLSEQDRENPQFHAVMVNDAVMDRSLWGAPQVTLLHQFATDPRVERIFVNPVIKRELCKSLTGDRAWLRKIRPWWGHEAHFHVRLSCPPGDEDCLPRDPIPAGDGCGAPLDWWFTPDAAHPKPSKGPHPQLPAMCKAILGK